VVLNQAEGRILYRFQARDLHLVMAPPAPGAAVRFRVLIDGQPPGAAHGADVDDQGNGTLSRPRLYQPGPVSQRTFEVAFWTRRPGLRRHLRLGQNGSERGCDEDHGRVASYGGGAGARPVG
jgi:Thioredoxin like C-terminal domain